MFALTVVPKFDAVCANKLKWAVGVVSSMAAAVAHPMCFALDQRVGRIRAFDNKLIKA